MFQRKIIAGVIPQPVLGRFEFVRDANGELTVIGKGGTTVGYETNRE